MKIFCLLVQVLYYNVFLTDHITCRMEVDCLKMGLDCFLVFFQINKLCPSHKMQRNPLSCMSGAVRTLIKIGVICIVALLWAGRQNFIPIKVRTIEETPPTVSSDNEENIIDSKSTQQASEQIAEALAEQQGVDDRTKEDNDRNKTDNDGIWAGIDRTGAEANTRELLKTDKLMSAEGNETCIKRLPQAIIVGVQKSGTTALLRFLSVHPQVAACLNPIETKYFSQFYGHKSLDWYRNLMPCSFANQVTIEKSPPYFYRRFCAERIRKMNQNTKIIIIVKDPIQRAISMYVMTKALSGKHMLPFEDMVTLNQYREVDQNNIFINWSNYPKYMQAWLDNFNLSQILVVDGNNLERDPAQELNKVEDFLGIDTYFKNDKFHFSVTKGKYCLVNKNNKTKCLGPGKGRAHPDIRESVRSVLVKYFSALNQKFFAMINRQFDWGY